MIDPVPVGYVALDQAVTRLVRDISDQDVREEYPRIEEKSRRFQSEDDLAKEDAPFTWNAFPEAKRGRIAAQQKAADISWAKREIAISRLYAALCDGGLTGLVREDQVFFQLTPVDWCNVAFWREIIIGGVVRASAGATLARHSGRRVLFEDASFHTWPKETLKRKAQNAAIEGNCQAWLEAEMRANPARTQPKSYWLAQAKDKFGVSERAFERVRAAALRATGAQWNRRGAPTKIPKK